MYIIGEIQWYILIINYFTENSLRNVNLLMQMYENIKQKIDILIYPCYNKYVDTN